MINMIGKVVAGHEIIKQGSEAVIGCRESDGEYVAWTYDRETGSCFWGRYGSKEYAEDAFFKKENGIYSGD